MLKWFYFSTFINIFISISLTGCKKYEQSKILLLQIHFYLLIIAWWPILCVKKRLQSASSSCKPNPYFISLLSWLKWRLEIWLKVNLLGTGVDIGMLKMNRPQPYEDFKRYLEDNSIDLSSGHLKVGFSFWNFQTSMTFSCPLFQMAFYLWQRKYKNLD